MDIRRLHPEDATTFVTLRREALEAHPLAFGASVEDDRGLSAEFVRASLADEKEQAVFGCFESRKLCGVVGVIRANRAKQRHKATIWGMYVAPALRGRGAGRALLEAAIAHARSWPGVEQVELSVSDVAEGARKLYEAAGFRLWGREPRALRWQGQTVDELHFVRELSKADGASPEGGFERTV